MKSDARQDGVGQSRKASWKKGVLSQLFGEGGAQMGREEGGGENVTPLEHLAPSEPCSTLSKPAVGSLPWLAGLLPAPPPLPVPEPPPESALSFLQGRGWGASDPFLLWEGTPALGFPPPFLWGKETEAVSSV